jgi:hypothetical protein
VVYDANVFHFGQKYAWRIRARRAPHNIYSDGKHLRSLAKKVGAKPIDRGPVWVFAEAAEIARRPEGGSITVPYPANKVVYRYHRESNTYRRSVSGEGKQVDASNKARIAPTNVIVMFMRFGPLNGGDSKGRLEADYIGSGPALISTNGKTIRGTWSKKSMKGPTRFFDKAGNPVTLTIGQTFVQVVRAGTKVTFVNGKVPAPSPSPSGSPAASPSPSPLG